jgi:CheY-like chemotaxis protein
MPSHNPGKSRVFIRRSTKTDRRHPFACTDMERTRSAPTTSRLRRAGRRRYASVMSQRVLIADDSAVARVTVARRVRAAGLEVLERDSCASASTVDGSTIACALLDFDLGDGFGVDVAARLRATQNTLPIAFFTSSSKGDVTEKASAFGPVFTKPDELDAAIDWIERQSRS